MPTIKLQPGNVKHLAAADKVVEFYDDWSAGVPGSLGLRVWPTGRRTWFISYRSADGKKRRFVLGHFPALGLADARKEAAHQLVAISKGHDPMAVKQARRVAPTVADVFDHYFAVYCPRKKKAASSVKEDRRVWQSMLQPRFGSLKAADLKRKDLVALHTEHTQKGSPVAANRILTLISTAYGAALDAELIDSTPCLRLGKIMNDEAPRDRALTDEEIRTIWKALDNETSNMRDILRLILLTAQRPGEVGAMERGEIDPETRTWTIPGTKTKNGLTHIVPLSPQAWAIVEPRLGGGRWLFPSNYGHRGREKTHTTTTKQARRRLKAATGINGWTSHDLRRTARTILAREGVPPHIAERLLNHKQPGMAAVYDVHQYQKEKAAALVKLADAIDRTLGAGRKAKVVGMDRRVVNAG